MCRIITLNVNSLNATTKRHGVAEWIRKHDPFIFCLQEIHLRSKDTLKVKGWKKTHNFRKLEEYQTNWTQRGLH